MRSSLPNPRKHVTTKCWLVPGQLMDFVHDQERISNLEGALVTAQYQEARNNKLAAKKRKKETGNELKHENGHF